MALPPAAKKGLAVALKETAFDSPKSWTALDAAFAAVGWVDPPDRVMPLAKDLTPEQRELLEGLAARDAIDLSRFYLPCGHLRRWLGLEKPGLLEHEVSFRFAKRKWKEPLWRALLRFENAGDETATRAFVKTLPRAMRLAAFAEINGAHTREAGLPYRLETNTLFDYYDSKLLGSLRAEGKVWAPRLADRMASNEVARGIEVRWVVFLALVRSKVPIEPRWDTLLPLGDGVYAKLMRECILAIPPERRDRAIADAVSREALYAAGYGMAALAKFPSAVLARAILDHGLDSDVYPKHRVLADMKKIAAKNRAVKAALDAFLKGKPAPAILTCTRSYKPTSATELDAIGRKQLELAGQRYDKQKLSAAERLAKGTKEGSSFRGLLEVRHLADASATPAYDVLLYMGDTGTIFRAGTTKVVAEIIQNGIETKSSSLADSLAIALEDR